MEVSWKLTHWVRRLVNFLGGLLLGLVAWGYYLTLRIWPNGVRYSALLVTAWLVYMFWPGARGTIRANIQAVQPGLDSAAIGRVARRFLRAFSHTWAFLLSGVRVDFADLRERVENADLLLAYHTQGKPTVVVFPHIGPVNELIPAVQALLIRVFIPAEAIAPLLYRLMVRQRTKYGDLEMERVRRSVGAR